MNPSLLSQSFWLALPIETRTKLALLFDMPEKGNVEVSYGPEGPKVISDGYGYEHLKLITIERMNEILGTEYSDFYATFGVLIDNLDAVMTGKPLLMPGSFELPGDDGDIETLYFDDEKDMKIAIAKESDEMSNTKGQKNVFKPKRKYVKKTQTKGSKAK